MLSNQQIKARLAVIIGAVLMLTLISTMFGLAWPLLTVEAGPTLPPRQPPAPTLPDKGDDSGDSPLIAYIVLQTEASPAGAWAAVQWQDTAGGWHDVSGWQGTLDSGGSQRWVVEAKDFSTGPFRWVVKQSSGGPVWGSSAPFNLPSGANETLRVVVSSG